MHGRSAHAAERPFAMVLPGLWRAGSEKSASAAADRISILPRSSSTGPTTSSCFSTARAVTAKCLHQVPHRAMRGR